MNLLVIGGAFLGALLSNSASPEAPLETPISSTVEQHAQKNPVPRTEPAQRTALPPASASENRGWMTRELRVDQKTGDTTEIRVIGFTD
ncbi:MAG TPA: hypothetical protein VIA80_06170 [Hyphomonadaceae bacterium]|jgi:hypothetical protein